MKDQINKMKTIEDYLLGKLSDSEAKEFEHKLEEDNNLFEQVETQKLLHELVIDRGLLDIKQKIKTGRYDNNNGWKTYTIISLAALITSASIGYFIVSNQKKSQLPNPTHASIDTTSKAIITHKTRPNNIPTEKTLSQTTTKTPTELADNSTPILPIISTKPNTKDTLVNAKVLQEEKKNVLLHNQEFKPSILPEKVFLKETNAKIDSTKLIHSSSFERANEKITEHAFSPSLGQVWEFPIETNGNYKISILNKNGQLVYQTNAYNGLSNTWNGTGNQGITINMGSYIFLIENQEGKITKGYVTITE